MADRIEWEDLIQTEGCVTKEQMQAQIASLEGQIQQLSTALEAVKTQFGQINQYARG